MFPWIPNNYKPSKAKEKKPIKKCGLCNKVIDKHNTYIYGGEGYHLPLHVKCLWKRVKKLDREGRLMELLEK